MTSAEEHTKKIKEHLEEIEDAINEGIEKKPITIGFHCSACSVQLLELFLHLENKISVGHVIKHDWFKRPKIEQKIEPLIERKLPVQFEKKKEIYSLIYEIEENRENLVYGKTDSGKIKLVLDSFNRLKEMLLPKIKEKGVEIE